MLNIEIKDNVVYFPDGSVVKYTSEKIIVEIPEKRQIDVESKIKGEPSHCTTMIFKVK